MAVDLHTIASGIEKTPPITVSYLGLTVFLSTVTSYIRSSTFEALKPTNPTLQWDDIVIPSLQVVPSQVLFHPWTLWTATFVEITPHQFIFGLIIIWFGITWLETHWNPKYNSSQTTDNASNELVPETFKFLAFVTISTHLVSLMIIIVINGLILPTPALLSHPLGYGVYVFIAPFAVVAKQLQPERNVKILSKFKFRLKRLPFIILSASLFLSLVLQTLFPFLPILVSFLVSWVYLRYLQRNFDGTILPESSRSNYITGDASDTMDMVEFFPESFKPVLKPLFNACYDAVILLGIVRPWNDDDIESGNLRSRNRIINTPATTTTHLNSSKASDERRKKMGLKVLEDSA